MCCIVLKCVALCCSVLQCVWRGFQFVAACCCVCQLYFWSRVMEQHLRVAACTSALYRSTLSSCSMLQWVAVWCSMVQYGAVWCSMVQYIVVCCSLLLCLAVKALVAIDITAPV